MATLTLTPFGKTVDYGGGIGSTLVNIVWVILVGWWMALGYVAAGLVNCITIIGIPFGLQSFKMPSWPCGRSARRSAICDSYAIARAVLGYTGFHEQDTT